MMVQVDDDDEEDEGKIRIRNIPALIYLLCFRHKSFAVDAICRGSELDGRSKPALSENFHSKLLLHDPLSNFRINSSPKNGLGFYTFACYRRTNNALPTSLMDKNFPRIIFFNFPSRANEIWEWKKSH